MKTSALNSDTIWAAIYVTSMRSPGWSHGWKSADLERLLAAATIMTDGKAWRAANARRRCASAEDETVSWQRRKQCRPKILSERRQPYIFACEATESVRLDRRNYLPLDENWRKSEGQHRIEPRSWSSPRFSLWKPVSAVAWNVRIVSTGAMLAQMSLKIIAVDATMEP